MPAGMRAVDGADGSCIINRLGKELDLKVRVMKVSIMIL